MARKEMIKRTLCLAASSLVLCASLTDLAPASEPPVIADRTAIDLVNSRLGIRSSSVQRLRLLPGSDQTVTTHINLDGHERTLVLHRHSLRSDRFQVFKQIDASGKLLRVEPPRVHTYRGTVTGLPNALVSASIVKGTLTATIRDGSDVFGVQPVAKLDPSFAENDHVVYRAADWINPQGFHCGAPHGVGIAGRGEPVRSANAAGVTSLQSAEIAIDADFELYELNGSSVENTIIDVETVLDTVEFIYERDVDISYEVTAIVVRTVEPDPYESTNADDVFCEMRARWNNGPEASIPRDVAHLFTGKDLDGSIIGTSRFAVICNISLVDPFGCEGGNANLAYGVSQTHFTETFTSRVALTAHELAHAWSSFHCDALSECHIMCSVLGSCDGIEGSNLKFSPGVRDSIESFRDGRTCLDAVTEPLTLPFAEDFSSGLVQESNWSYNQGTIVTNTALAAPSAPFTLNMDAAGPAEFGDDEIRSSFIALDQVDNAQLTYHTQHRGVESGESLLVEYWSSELTWKQLNQIVSDGIDQETFELFTHVLPDDAGHAEFRVRFRTEVSDSSDDWYVDNVNIVQMCSDGFQCLNGAFCDGEELCIAGLCAPGTANCSGADGCDEDLNVCVSSTCGAVSIIEASNRFLSIVPPDGVDPIAIIVAPTCDAGAAKYVGIPSSDGIATLVDDPEDAARLAPSEWNGLIRVRGIEIVPGTDYQVWTECGEAEQRFVSLSAAVSTPIWGDVVGSLVDGVWTAPDGAVNVTTDVLALITAFQGEPVAPATYRIDLMGFDQFGLVCVPDLEIDILDILHSISGFQGVRYSVATSCPDPCSSE